MERHRKRELRELNTKAWAGEKDVFPVQGSLDSSMKKNTAFIKRLRTAMTGASKDTFVSEVRSLSLHKYLSEIISACYEGLTKLKTPGDIATGVEVISALHQRFGPAEFTGYIGWHIGRGLATPDKGHLKALPQDVREREEKERLARQRVLLRVATELWLVGVLRSLDDVVRPEEASKNKENLKGAEGLPKSKSATNGARADNADAEPFPLEVLKDMLGHDREHINLPLVVIFVKSFSWDVLGTKSVSSEGRKTVNEDGAISAAGGKTDEPAEEDEEDSEDPPITSPELRQRFKNVLNRYFEDVKAHLVRDQEKLVNQGRRNAEAYVKSGEVFEDRQANYEKQVKAQDKLLGNAQVLADAVGAEMPDLKEKDTSTNSGDGSIGLVKTGEYLRGQGEGPGIWEDEEERRFYENLIDLKDRVPGILLEDGKKKKGDGDDQVGKRVEPDNKEEAAVPADAKAAEGEDQSTAIANKSVGAQVDALLARLPEFVNKDQVDEMAIEFCFLNSKASRNRLIKAVSDIPKGRTDLLPLYARLVATLGKYMSDVIQGIVAYLDDEFRSLQRRKQKDFLGQVRMINVRYLAELTKFGAVPEHVIFHCLKVSLDDFSRMNIEIICNLLENCGRYLLRNPETSPRMASFLETLQRKKTASHLGQQERMLIENAMYYVNPPERAAIEQKERTPLELFIRKLIYLDLTKRNLDKVVKQIRKLHWEEEEVVCMLHKIFTKPGRIKYSNVHLLAVILGSLNRHHQDFCISVIDDLLENITLGLELNDFKFNQRRVAEVKYLGELYIYRMVDSPVIFDTLYKLVTFGYEGGTPRPGSINPLDPPDDFFRIRLVCNLLETCGMYYDKGQAKKKLDFFLTFFQYYIKTKDPLPMDIEFMVQDAYALTRPQWKLATTLEEAGNTFAEAVKANYQLPQPSGDQEDQDDESGAEDGDEGDGGDDDELQARERNDASSGEDADTPGEEDQDSSDSDSEEEEEHIVVTRPEDERDPEADADFDRELAKMMAESLDSRKFERKPMFDVPLPMKRNREAPAPSEENAEQQRAEAAAAPTMKFALLSKRGNKQQTKAIDLPADSTFAVAMRTQQEAERAEQQRIKNLVLNYDLRDENESDGDTNFPLTPNLNKRQHTLFQQRRGSRRSNKSSSQSGNRFLASSRPNNTGSTNTQQSNKNGNVNVYDNTTGGLEKQHNPYNVPRIDKASNNRSTQRARKLQLSDVDWYDNQTTNPNTQQRKNTAAPNGHGIWKNGQPRKTTA
ncbi:nonsense-mediated mrna decay factor [Diplodia corticola]|uniref:Nonsense-mediated mrna decay factor n=1 Tax=Diplodia corticola TaxID=236234 RepID=A0A1J9RHF0_9PEZI|nr:nonsense-mediated mrna decay factor [Diplodia corticola]OJD31971.1 nonsense-mediated mrna decay factor [Diplodia corticola]